MESRVVLCPLTALAISQLAQAQSPLDAQAKRPISAQPPGAAQGVLDFLEGAP
jgi:hypothetical protein